MAPFLMAPARAVDTKFQYAPNRYALMPLNPPYPMQADFIRRESGANRLVTFDSVRLRAVMELAGFTAASLAKRLNSRSQSGRSAQYDSHSISALMHRRSRCRRSRRLAISRELQVPDAWLGGGDPVSDLPFVTQMAVADLSLRSPRAALAMLRLIDLCANAARRDLSAYRVVGAKPGRAEKKYAIVSAEDLGPISFGDAPISVLLHCLMQWASVSMWRNDLTPDTAGRPTTEEERRRLSMPPSSGPHEWPEPAPMRPAEEERALTAIRDLEGKLHLWISGRQPLRYDVLADHLAALGAVRAQSTATKRGKRALVVFVGGCDPRNLDMRAWGVGKPTALVHRETGEIIDVADARTPFALLRWSSGRGRARKT